jgi:hypothetical protein
MTLRLFGLLVLSVLPPLMAQKAPETRLTRAEARFPAPFSTIAGLRELPDGRVLVSDGIDETVLRVDFRTGKMDTLSRAGSGPGEYKSPDLLFAVPGGGTMLVDLGNARLSFYDQAFKYQSSQPIARGEPGRGMTMVVPQAVDAQGRLYFQAMMRDPGSMRADSGAVLRLDRTTGTIDTVARLKLGEVEVSQSGGVNNRSVSMRPIPMSPEDEWGVAPDGGIAVARAVPYALEWIAVGKAPVRGPAIQHEPVPIRDADKKEWARDMANGLSVMVQNENGKMSVRMGRGMRSGMADREEVPDLKWPDTKPAFRNVLVDADGDAWVERHVAAAAPRQYDVFSADAVRKRTVVLPAGRRLIGFGNGVLYLRDTDQDELQYLERYRK